MASQMNTECLVPTPKSRSFDTSQLETNGIITTQSKPKSGPLWSSLRLRIGLLLMNSSVMMCFLRANISMSMVCMVNNTAVQLQEQDPHQHPPFPINSSANTSVEIDSCSAPEDIQQEYDGELTWSSGQQGAVFSALWIGSFIATVPSGVLADRCSAKNLLSVVYIVSGIMSLLSPLAAEFGGYVALAAARLITGLAVGFVLSSMTVIIIHWIPPNERSTILAIATSGNQVGLIFAFPLFAWLCSLRSIAKGWPLIFYFCGGYCAVSLLIWQLFMTNRPAKHRLISVEELEFIKVSLENQNLITNKKQKPVIPLLAILCSKAVWACIITNFAAGFHVHLMATYLPTYFKDVLFFNLKTNGWFSMLPYVVMLVFKYLWSFIADWLKTRRAKDAEMICKMSQFVSSVLCAIFIIVCSLLDCSHSSWAVALICLSNGALGGQTPGFMTSLMSIGPKFSGTLRSVCSVFSMAAGILCPYLVGFIVVDRTRQEWQIVFAIDSAMMFASGIVFLLIGTTHIQPWAQRTADLESLSQSNITGERTTEEENNLKPILSKEAINTL